MALKHKAFLEALKLITAGSHKAKAYLVDKRMTQQEKQILSAQLAIRDAECADAVEILTRFTSTDQFVESQRAYVLGFAYNGLSQYEKALESFMRSIELNNFAGAIEHKLSALRMVFTVHLNSVNILGMQDVLAQIQSLKIDSKRLYTIVLNCELAIAINSRDADKVHALVPKLEKDFPNFGEDVAVTYFLNMIDWYFFENDLTQVQAMMADFRKLKKYKNTEQVKYLQAIVNYLTQGVPLYLYEKDYDEYPVLQDHIVCLLALERGDQAEAMNAWQKLTQQQPHNFSEPFKYLGPPIPFSRCLDALLTPIEKHVIPDSDKNTLEAKFLTLLQEHQTPVSKEEIHLKLWGKPALEKKDLDKLFKVAQRARERYQIELKTIKGAYALVPKKKAA